jgi:hypothetical protein
VGLKVVPARIVVQPLACLRTVWTRAPDGATIHAMPLALTDVELATAAQARRAMAHQERERAKKPENPTTRGLIDGASKRYRALAEK